MKHSTDSIKIGEPFTFKGLKGVLALRARAHDVHGLHTLELYHMLHLCTSGFLCRGVESSVQ